MKARRYYRDARDCYEELGMDKLVDQMEDRISDCTNAYDQEVETDVSDLKERYAQAQQYEDQGDAALYAGEYDRAISLYYQARTIYSELELYQRVSDVQAKIDRVQQGMASFFDVDISVGVENRLAALVMSGQPGPGKDKIQGGQKLLVKADLLREGRGLVA